MTGSTPSPRTLKRRLRRLKRELERVNPVEEPETFRRRFEAVVELEVALRDHPDEGRS